MKFLETRDTIPEIRKLLESGSPVRAAVSYWGDGAIDSLGITEDSDLIIVCDILSGGCNPTEIRKLLSILGRTRVLTFDGLHSKVWLGAGFGILGSSNASANGLGFEGNEAASLVEANLVFDAPAALASMGKWWSGRIRRDAREITESDLRRAKNLRDRQRKVRPLTRHPDLLTGLRAEPESYKDRGLYVWVWKHGTVGDWFDEALEQAQEQFGADVEAWQWDEEPPPPGSFVIDFNSEFDPPQFGGIYRILADQPIYQARRGNLLLCMKVNAFEGMKLGSRAAWQAAARIAALKANDEDEWEANDFARFIPPP